MTAENQTKKKTKKPKINTADWRNLPLDSWNVRTFHAYFVDMNRERFGVEYVPMRNWSFERGVIKKALDTHGPVLLKAACDEVFRTYRPTREFPLLTAGFAILYRVNTIIPRLKTTQQAEKVTPAVEQQADLDAIKAWL